jgi:hypothetical protein
VPSSKAIFVKEDVEISPTLQPLCEPSYDFPSISAKFTNKDSNNNLLKTQHTSDNQFLPARDLFKNPIMTSQKTREVNPLNVRTQAFLILIFVSNNIRCLKKNLPPLLYVIEKEN